GPDQEGGGVYHLPGEDGTQLRRGPARPRLAPADRQVPGGHPGQLEAGRRLRDRAVAHRPGGAQAQVPEGLQGAQALPPDDAAAEPLSGRRRHAPSTAITSTSPVTYVPSAPTKRSGSTLSRLFARIIPSACR